MRIRYAAFCTFILLISATIVRADGIPPVDPVITMEGGSGSTVLNTLNDPAFNFTYTKTIANQNQAVVFVDYINNTGFQIGQVDTTYTDTVPLSFSCIAPNIYFNNCSPKGEAVSLSPGGTLLVSYFGLDATHPGIPTSGGLTCNEFGCTPNNALSDFAYSIKVSDVPLGGSFSYTGLLIATPEPSTILLLLVAGGLVFLFNRSKMLPVPR